MHLIRTSWTKACLKFQQENNRRRTYTWKLNNALLNDNLIKEEIKKEIKDFLEFNENEEPLYQNLLDTMKAVVKGKLIHSSKCLKKKLEKELTLAAWQHTGKLYNNNNNKIPKTKNKKIDPRRVDGRK